MNTTPPSAACDWLVFAAHPDDAELGMGGTLLKARDRGLDVVLVDWTRGELGTRGNAETRAAEAQAATALLGLRERLNLDLGDALTSIWGMAILKEHLSSCTPWCDAFVVLDQG